MTIEKLFELGKKEGFEEQEVYEVNSESLEISVFDGEIDKYSMSQEGGLSYRGLLNNKMGYSYTEKVEDSTIDMLVAEAKANAEIIESEDKVFIFKGSPHYKTFDHYKASLKERPVKDKIDFMLDLEKAIKEADSRVKSLAYNGYNEVTFSKHIANTHGLDIAEKKNFCVAYAMVVVEEKGDTRTGMGVDIGETFEELSIEKIVKQAVGEAVQMLGAEPIASKNMPVVFKNTVFADLLSTFIGNYSAESVQKDLSKLKGKLGEKIAADCVTFVDDPHMDKSYFAMSFDAEGVATKPKNIIENGVLKTYLHNLKTANIDGVESTGNAAKGGFKGTISIAPNNFYLKEGTHSFEEIIGSVEDGIYLVSLQGLHAGVSSISGDFSLQCYGYQIEQGKLTKPVSQITVAGNYYELLNDIEMVGNDLEFSFAGSDSGSPTVKVKSLAISGK